MERCFCGGAHLFAKCEFRAFDPRVRTYLGPIKRQGPTLLRRTKGLCEVVLQAEVCLRAMSNAYQLHARRTLQSVREPVWDRDMRKRARRSDLSRARKSGAFDEG